MLDLRSRYLLAASALLLGACVTGNDSLIPTLAGEPASGLASFAPIEPAPGVDTGTVVGRRVDELERDFAGLQRSIAASSDQLQAIRGETVQNAQDYYGIVAAINARLQVGTTPGNPILVAQWGDAQVKLDEISADVARMNGLSGTIAADSTVAAYLLESVRATYGLAGAVEEDHRQLSILEDEINRTVVLIDRLLNEVSQDINRQTAYLANERSDLQALQVAITNGELYGSSLANQAYFSAAPLPNAAHAAAPTRLTSTTNIASTTDIASAGVTPVSTEPVGAGAAADGRPLVIIRFDQPNVEYRQAVYRAVSEALGRHPEARFDLVALSPVGGSPADAARAANSARGSAEDVRRTLVTLGLPADRVTLSSRSGDVAGPEVHIHVR